MNIANKILLLVTFLWLTQFLSLNPIVQPVTYSYGDMVAIDTPDQTVSATTSDIYSTGYQSMIFVGDVMLARNVESLMKSIGASYPYAGIALQALAPHPAIIGNFEASMATPHVMTPVNGMQFSVPEDVLPATSQAGFTHFSVANNHSLDYGSTGFKKTKEHLLAQHIEVFGQSRSLSDDSVSYLKTVKGTIALIGINSVSYNPPRNEVIELLKKVKQQSDWQIAYIHWGDEYVEIHNESQAALAQILVDAGIDLIVGHHPHVVQDVQVIDDVVVAYSLGNYIFDQYFSQPVQEGIILSIVLMDTPIVNLVPVSSIDSLSQPRLMAPRERQEFLKKLADRSDPTLRTYITSGYVPLSNFVASSSKMAIMVP